MADARLDPVRDYINGLTQQGFNDQQIADAVKNQAQATGYSMDEIDKAMGYTKNTATNYVANYGSPSQADTANKQAISATVQPIATPTSNAGLAQQNIITPTANPNNLDIANNRIQQMQYQMPQYQGIFNPAPSSSAKGASTKGAAQGAAPVRNSSSMKGA